MKITDIPRYTLEEISCLRRYNGWMLDKIRPFLGRRVLEVGCGIGTLSDYFLDRDFLMVSDVSAGYIAKLKEKYAGSPNVRVAEYRLGENISGRQDMKEFNFDTLVCVNVLEHIADDSLALAQMREILPAGGRLVLLVPALKFLYGSLDKQLYHYRRYGRKELILRVEGNGFSVQDCFYFNCLGALGWFINSRVLNLKFIPQRTFAWSDKLVPFLRFWEDKFKFNLGQSLVVIAKRI